MVEVEVGSGGRGSGEGGALILSPQDLSWEEPEAQACRHVALDHLLPHSPVSVIAQTRRVMPRNIHFSPTKLRSSEPGPRACALRKGCSPLTSALFKASPPHQPSPCHSIHQRLLGLSPPTHLPTPNTDGRC